MKKLAVGVVSLGACLVLGLPVAACAQVAHPVTIYDIDFSGETNGAEPTLGSPPSHLQGVGYDGGTNGFTAEQNHQIGDVSGLTKAVIMRNTAPAGNHVNWLDTGFRDPAGTVVTRLEFDLAPVTEAGPSQDNGGFRSDWAVVAFKYGDSGASVAWVFALSHTNSSVLEMENAPPANIPIGTCTNGQVTHVRVDTYYDSGTYSVYLNGSLAADRFALRTPMSGTNDHLGEFFIQEPGTSNTVVGLDNFQYTAYVPVPEPSPLLLVAVGLLGVGAFLRRGCVRH